MTWSYEQSKRRRDRLRAERKCTDCVAGLQPEDGVLCVECAEKRNKYRRKYRKTDAGKAAESRYRRGHLELRARLARENYLRRKVDGECVRCPSKAADDSVFCPPCRDADRADVRERARIRREKARAA
jgi:hypothetical protein